VTRALTKRFGDALALDGLDLEVARGEVFGFLGPNGAGKTTTIRLLLDLVRPTRGSASVLGLDPRRDAAELHARMGYLPGDVNLPARQQGRAYLSDHAAIRRLDPHRSGRAIDELAERLGADLDRPMGDLSLGNRRKVAMIDAFAHRPELLVLDEPTGGLDPLVQQTFRALAREAAGEGRTVFLSSHVLDEVQHVADRVAVLRQGRLVAEDRIEALLARLARSVTVTFVDPSRPPGTGDGPPVDLSAFARVPHLQHVAALDGGRVEFVVDGPIGALVEAIAPWHPYDVRVDEPDLEDLFLGYYGGPEGSAPPTSTDAAGDADRTREDPS
jgi:ABC-2 type transport system ATP-binding protein